MRQHRHDRAGRSQQHDKTTAISKKLGGFVYSAEAQLARRKEQINNPYTLCIHVTQDMIAVKGEQLSVSRYLLLSMSPASPRVKLLLLFRSSLVYNTGGRVSGLLLGVLVC